LKKRSRERGSELSISSTPEPAARRSRKMWLGEIRDYLGRLVYQGASPERVKMHVAGLKFLYGITLDRKEVAGKILWPKVPHRKPDILSLAEVERLSLPKTSSGGRVAWVVGP
jgi:hypothetical protein